jgi:FAD/FMN-containing dehydrogenase
VGVGGFLVGGGTSFYISLYGFACDNVANSDIVLANGDIVNAIAKSHVDLWRALKGGSGNFGIVTRFHMYTFPAQDIWGGVRVALRSEAYELARTMVAFTNNFEKHPEMRFCSSARSVEAAPLSIMPLSIPRVYPILLLSKKS